MAGAMPRDEHFDLVMAVPMHWLKRWARGFNQAELLAKPVAHRLGVPLARNLKRRKLGKSQAGLDFADRMTNLKNAFYLRHPEQLAGRRILLVDDVFTTGATLRSAASLLKQAGARRVCALALARAELRYRGGPVSATTARGSTPNAATTDEHSRRPTHARSGSAT